MRIALLAATFLASTTLSACADTAPGDAQKTDHARNGTITTSELHRRLASGERPLVVDVREPHEYEASHIEGARLVPLGGVSNGLPGVEKDTKIVLVCRSGNRSGKAQKILAERGYSNLANVEGGMLAWEKNGYPVVKKK